MAVCRLFDHYAPYFDASLAQLHYRAPALIAERLAAMVVSEGSLDILDAGWGTGLCAPLLRPFVARLVGVDLSAGMLKEAKSTRLGQTSTSGLLLLREAERNLGVRPERSGRPRSHSGRVPFSIDRAIRHFGRDANCLTKHAPYKSRPSHMPRVRGHWASKP